jgi:hypothetical protein
VVLEKEWVVLGLGSRLPFVFFPVKKHETPRVWNHNSYDRFSVELVCKIWHNNLVIQFGKRRIFRIVCIHDERQLFKIIFQTE